MKPEKNTHETKQESTAASDDPDRPRRSHEKPLAIRGTLDDVLRAAMNVKPKDEQRQHPT